MARRATNAVRIGHVKQDLVKRGLGGLNGAHLHLVEHHRAHLASAFFAAPFEEAAVISIDGFGDFSSMMWGVGCGNRIEVRGSVQFPHSLGLFYTAITQLLGFTKYGDEYKMMGLGAYGEPRFAPQMRNLISAEKDQILLNLPYFQHHTVGVELTWNDGEPVLGPVYSPKLVEEFGPARAPRGEIEQRHRDLAASAQLVLEEIYFHLLNYIQRVSGKKAICLAGGVALNCVANGMIFSRTGFREVYIQPAAHDAGTAIGAALHVQHQVLGAPRSFVMQHVYYGSESTTETMRHALTQAGTRHHQLSPEDLFKRTAFEIAAGRIVGWYQGRAEFGPRALGNRSILADPRNARMKEVLNRRIKHRESFRPFCPSILSERAGDYFETDYPSPFMVMAYKIKSGKREVIPAVTHGDGTGRLQTVEKSTNPLYWNLIREFEKLTGVPVLLNTSFNENEPIVEEPHQAVDCFLRTQMDVLVLGQILVLKTENRAAAEFRGAQSEAAMVV